MSQVGSRASKRSNVDDTLFGSKKATGNVRTQAGVITMDELRKIRGETEKKGKNDAVIISKNELARIKDCTTIKTKQDLINDKKLLAEQKEAKQMVSKARKAKMQELDAKRDAAAPTSEWQKGENQKNQTLLARAQKTSDEDMDDVKHMNQMVLYSKVVTIRDKQLQENKRLEAEYVEEQKKLDLMMEIERLKVLKEEEEREVRKQEARKKGAQVIVDQIMERTQVRMKEQELRDKERLELLANIDKMKKEDEAAAAAKRERINVLMKQAAEANAQSLIEKEKRKQEAIDEENKIIAYQKAKDQREYEEALEQQRIKDEKEKEIQKLREMQEKAADRQAEIDALRAKRAYEEEERQARLREKLEHEKRQRISADLEKARQRQFQEKQMNLAEQARIEREDYMAQIQKQKMIEAEEKKVEEQKKQALVDHSVKVRGQISNNAELKKQERLDYLEEGRKVREKVEAERQKVRDIQAAKINDLKTTGIQDKYLYELQKKTVSF